MRNINEFFKISDDLYMNKLQNIKRGNLRLVNYDGKVYHFGELENELTADIKINNQKFFFKLILGGSLILIFT